MNAGTLQGRRVLVTGVTGNVGWGVAAAALDAQAEVVALSRRGSRQELVDALELDGHAAARLAVEAADLADPRSVAALRERLAAAPPIDHVFAALGGWWQRGPIAAQNADEYAQVRGSLLDAQVHLALAVLPQLHDRAGASYTIVTGAGGQLALPDTGLLVIAVSGVFGLSRMLRTEHAQDAVRVNEILVEARIERRPRPGVVPAREFGIHAVTLMTGRARSEVLRFTPRGLAGA